MLRKHKILFLSVCLLLFFTFTYQAWIYLDPDLGWHIQLGSLIVKKGIPLHDPFSFTMPSFPFIDHEWLTNMWISQLFEVFGKLPVSALFTVFVLLSLYFSIHRGILAGKRHTEGENLLRLTLFITGAGALLQFFGVRPQVQSWLLFSVFLGIVLDEKKWQRLKFTIPLLTIFWVNLHGSFAISIVSLFIVVFLKSIRLKKIWGDGLFILLLCVASSFVNPYGSRIWHEVWQQISDTSVRWTIQEWLPVFFSFNIFYIFLAVLSFMVIKKHIKHFYIEALGLNIFFFVQSFMSARHIPLWIIIDLPMVYLGLNKFYFEVKDIPFGRERYLKTIKTALVVVLVMFLATVCIFSYGGRGISEKSFYPHKAIEFLKMAQPNGQVFSEYGWGGYLIWKLPEKKVFIDGRMATWKWEGSVLNESDYVMGDYKKILRGEISYSEQFEKYNIDTVLWPKPKRTGNMHKLENKILSMVIGEDYMSKKFSLIEALKSDGWTKVHEDEVAVVYRKI